MSLALDLGLFFRNSKTKLNLSLQLRAILFTLAMRIGNNASSWVKQETLAEELGIHAKTLCRFLSSLKDSGLLIIDKQKHDQRYKQYKFHESLINYHLLTDEDRINVHKIFNDEFSPPKNSQGKIKKQVTDPLPTSDNRLPTDYLLSENRLPDDYLLSDTESHAILEHQAIPVSQQSPKATYKSKYTNKDKEKSENSLSSFDHRNHTKHVFDKMFNKESRTSPAKHTQVLIDMCGGQEGYEKAFTATYGPMYQKLMAIEEAKHAKNAQIR